MKLGLILILFFITNVGFSQKETNIWYFGINAGLDFNSGSPVILLNGALMTDEGCATISDASGNLLFYTDGITVYNRNHTIMQNGAGLKGHSSSTSSALIVPKPNNSNIYYIFTVDAQAKANGLQYSEVDITLDGGLGGITTNKNILLTTPTTEKLTAIKSSISNEYWVVSHKWNSNEFVSYKVSSLGVSPIPIVSAVGTVVDDSPVIKGTAIPEVRTIGQIKISPDGKKLAVARSEGLSEAQLFDFDAATGVVSNPITLLDFPDDNQMYGVEFSPNSKVLYISSPGNGIYQYNLNAGSPAGIVASQFLITPIRRPYDGMQLASDGKIYVAKSDNFIIDVIDNPNALGAACNFQFESLYLGGRRSKAGLPPFIQSFLQIDDIQFENVCFGNTTIFSLIDTVDSAVWNFGDALSGANNTSTDLAPIHVFSAPGNYNVSVNVTIGTQTASSNTTVTIYEQPTATQPQDVLICDDDNDGFYSFDLTQQNATILNGQDPVTFEVVHYASMVDYTNNQPIVNPTSYRNTVDYASETIVAAVKNRNNKICEDTTSFNIQVFDSPKPNQSITKFTFCDNTSVGTDADGMVQFDLTQKETEILNGQLVTEFKVRYFKDASFLNEIANPYIYINTNVVETIYVQVSNRSNPLCVTTTQFDIEVLELPITSSIIDLKQCDDDLDGFSAFNLNEVISKITANASAETITFYETQADANLKTNYILNTTTYTNQVVSTDIIWARVENTNQCFRTTQVNLIVSTTQIPVTFTRDFFECDDDLDGDSTNGISIFDFSTVSTEIESMFPIGQQLIINYYRNEADALAESNPITDITNYRNDGYPNAQNIYIRVDSAVNNDCLGLGHHITLYVERQPVANSVITPEQCDDDGDTMYAFDTTNIEATILNGQIGMTVSYIDELGKPLSSPLPNPFITTSQTIKAKVTNVSSQDKDGACYDETNIIFKVDAASVAHPIDNLIECDDDSDGKFLFDTSSIETMVLKNQIGMKVTYTDEKGINLPTPLPNPFLSASQTITVRVESPLNSICYDETIFKLIVVEKPVLGMSDTWLICKEDSVKITADSGYDEYLWSTGETASEITVYNSGNYEVTATSIYEDIRCETSKTITVVESNIATITKIETKDWKQNDNVITIFSEGLGEYEYSLDGIIYQDSNTFENLKTSNYTVFVKDKKGCGVVTDDVYLMYYPRFFTPNSDGQHDTWHIYNPSLEPNNKIYIYDRYGKLLKQLGTESLGWDGTINGEKMPSSEYWFIVYRQNGIQYKGHFSLKR